MNNKKLALQFDLLAKLMELHDENPFKIKSYTYAFGSLRKLEGDISSISHEELTRIPGIGASIVEKITELLSKGDMKVLADLREKTPEGVRDMLMIKGLGPKKVKQIWKEMEIETIGELLYACQENRLVKFKGFGEKLQKEIQEKLEYFISAQGKFLYGHVIDSAEKLKIELNNNFSQYRFDLIGDVARKMPEICGIEIITDCPQELFLQMDIWQVEEESLQYESWPVYVEFVSIHDYVEVMYNRTAHDTFLQKYPFISGFNGDADILKNYGLSFIPIETREAWVVNRKIDADKLITVSDIKGIIHNHSTYSDGLHSLSQMSSYVRESGYDYFVISDHSKTAFYAQGLSIESVYQQWQEIDQLNLALGPDFKVYKSIESDILTDGSLDYTDEVLAGFDLVIASIHSGLQMDLDKATARVIKAVENQYTRILGHPTSRLLLTRPGYPLDFEKVIDACAANNVAIELNANPQRLDIDWTWIPYCMDKGVKIAINPDAHSRESIHYIRHGVAAARKGGLTKGECINTFSKSEFDSWLATK
jgi:DNA polymerase (family 10)